MSLVSFLSRWRRLLFLAGVLGGLNLIIFYWALGPLLAAVRATSAAVTERERTYYEYLIRAQDYERAQQALAGVTSDAVKLRSFFLMPADVLPFVLALEANARAAGVTQELSLLGDTRADSQKNSTAGHALDLLVTAEGHFPDLIKYLGLVENMPYFLNAWDVQVARFNQASLTKPSQLKLNYHLRVATTTPITSLVGSP